MNVWTDRYTHRQIDRQTDGIHRYHVYVGLARVRPKYAILVPPLVIINLWL